MDKSIPRDLDLLPELYRQFNALANNWLSTNYSGNQYEYRSNPFVFCYLQLYPNGANNRNSIVFYLGKQCHSFDTIQDALIAIDQMLRS